MLYKCVFPPVIFQTWQFTELRAAGGGGSQWEHRWQQSWPGRDHRLRGPVLTTDNDRTWVLCLALSHYYFSALSNNSAGNSCLRRQWQLLLLGPAEISRAIKLVLWIILTRFGCGGGDNRNWNIVRKLSRGIIFLAELGLSCLHTCPCSLPCAGQQLQHWLHIIKSFT